MYVYNCLKGRKSERGEKGRKKREGGRGKVGGEERGGRKERDRGVASLCVLALAYACIHDCVYSK